MEGKLKSPERSTFSIILLILTINICRAQDHDLGSWNILGIKYNIDNKWSIFGEGQVRATKFFRFFNYYELKGGFNYHFNPNVRLTFGSGKYETYPEGGNFVLPKTNDEFRLWPQVILLQQVWKLKIEQRYRSEFRFTSSGYRNRFRYRLGLSYPFGKEVNGLKPFQVGAANELFLSDKEPYFEKNRFQLSFNYFISKAAMLQLGYLHQYDFKINNDSHHNYLQLGLFFELFRRQSQNSLNDHHLKDN